MTLSCTPSPIPTGGAILLDLTLPSGAMSAQSPMTLSRAATVSGVTSAFVPLYSGDALPLFIDAGDSLPQPLTAGTAYTYRLADPTGSVETAAILPASALVLETDDTTKLLVRLLQAGLTNITLPPGIQSAQAPNQGRPQVSSAMPITGFPVLPYVVVNEDLVQQENVPIGQNVTQPDGNNLWTQASYARKIWRVSVLSRTSDERDFYRDALIAIFQSILGSVFQHIGANMSHRYQASSSQTADEYQGKSPGFYFADIMLEVLGTFNTGIRTFYGLIEAIQTNVVLPDGQVDQTLTGTPEAPV